MNLRAEARALLLKNRRVTGGMQYTVPSPDAYPYQWLWDSCFHAIVLARLEPEAAVAELRSLLSKQFPDGMLPHMIYWEPGPLHAYEWGRSGVSAITQPPMLAYALWELYRHTGDLAPLAELYDRTFAYYRYLIEKRDPRDRHLVGIINPDESGEDNSPRFDAVLNVPPDISIADHLRRRLELIDANRVCEFDAELCMKKHFWVKDVTFNAIMVANLRILARIADALGKSSDREYCELHARLVAESMRQYMFADGVFWSTAGESYEQLRVATWGQFMPLFAGLYSREEAAILVRDHLQNGDTFAAPHGIRTVSKTEPSYRPDALWRGPVWIAAHWFLYHGLSQYEFAAEAADIKAKSTALIEREGFREYFDPETGAGHGARNFTWGTLVVDME